MATYTGTFASFYTSFKEWMADGTIDLDTDAFGVLLTTSTYTPATTHQFVSDITNEVTGNGYARDALTTVTWTASGTQLQFNADDATFTASGGSIVARYWVLYDNANGTDASRELVAYGLLDNTPADVTTTDTNTLTIQWGATIFNLD